MKAKPGATSANNRMARGLVRVDPSIDVSETRGLVMRAAVVVDSMDFLKEPPRDGKLFNGVMIGLHGRVKSLTCDHLPGAEGTRTRFVFGEPKQVESGDDVIEPTGDVRPDTSLDTSMPKVSIINRLSFEQLYLMGAKGGFVPGYEDEATKALNDALVSRTLIEIPVSVTYLNAAPYMEFVDIENPHDIEIATGELGYDFVQFLPISNEMSKNPERVVEDEVERTLPEIESVSVSEIYEKGLVDLEDEVTDDLAVETAELVEDEVETDERSMPDYIGPQGYTAEGHLSGLDEDYRQVLGILAEIRGESAAEPAEEQDMEPVPEAASETKEQEDGSFDFDGSDDIFAEDKGAEEEQAVSDAADRDVPETVELSLDDIEDALALDADGISEDEQEHRDHVEEQGRIAAMDMGNDGAKSISSAQLNEPDPRFADEFDGLDM